jgi:hypothetical protein
LVPVSTVSTGRAGDDEHEDGACDDGDTPTPESHLDLLEAGLDAASISLALPQRPVRGR